MGPLLTLALLAPIAASPRARADHISSSGAGRIAFYSAGAIGTMKPDGSDVRTLTAGPGDIDPVWSPDGTRIAFSRNGPGLTFDIWVMNRDGSNEVRLTDADVESDEVFGNPTWSPDGSRIVFTRGSCPAQFVCISDVWVMDDDGTDQSNLTNSLGERVPGHNPDFDDAKYHYSQPDWSPTGELIAYIRHEPAAHPSPPDLWTMTANGASQSELVGNASGSPAWSPDGEHIAFERWGSEAENFSPDVWVANADGSGAVNLTNDGGDSMYPTWSPDGHSIAWTEVSELSGILRKIGANGSDRSRVETGFSVIDPDWWGAAKCDTKVAHDVYAAAWQNPNDEEDRNDDYLEFELRTFWCSTPAGIRIIDIEAPKGRTLTPVWKGVFVDPAIELVFTLHDEWRKTKVSQQLDGPQATITTRGKWETCMGIPFFSMGPRGVRALATLVKRIQKSDRFPRVVRETAKQMQRLLRKAAFYMEEGGKRLARRALKGILWLLDKTPRSVQLKLTEALWKVLREWELSGSWARDLFWKRWAKVPITALLGDVHCSESWKPKIRQTLHADGTSEVEFVDVEGDNPMWEWRRTGGSTR